MYIVGAVHLIVRTLQDIFLTLFIMFIMSETDDLVGRALAPSVEGQWFKPSQVKSKTVKIGISCFPCPGLHLPFKA